MTGSDTHGTTPHTADDILAVARHPDAAAPTAIHVGPTLHARLVQEAAASAVRLEFDSGHSLCRLDGIPVVVDEELPAFPGYEIHRNCVPDVRLRAA